MLFATLLSVDNAAFQRHHVCLIPGTNTCFLFVSFVVTSLRFERWMQSSWPVGYDSEVTVSASYTTVIVFTYSVLYRLVGRLRFRSKV